MSLPDYVLDYQPYYGRHWFIGNTPEDDPNKPGYCESNNGGNVGYGTQDPRNPSIRDFGIAISHNYGWNIDPGVTFNLLPAGLPAEFDLSLYGIQDGSWSATMEEWLVRVTVDDNRGHWAEGKVVQGAANKGHGGWITFHVKMDGTTPITVHLLGIENLESDPDAGIPSVLSVIAFDGGPPIDCTQVWQKGLGLSGDLNKDCKLNFLDFTSFAQKWLLCNDPMISGCVETWP